MNATEYQYGFGFNKQSDIDTSLATAKISKCLPMDGFAPIKAAYPNEVSDGNWYGKGNDFPTFRTRITERFEIPSRAFALSPTSAIFAPAFVLGNIATASVTAGVYDHTLTFQDKSNKNCKLTTIIEKAGTEYAYKMSGTVINGFTLDLNRTDLAKISWDGTAVARATFTSTMPSVTAEDCYYKMLDATLKIGAVDGSADVSADSLSGKISVSQNPNAFEMPGGSGKISQILIGKQTVSGNIKLLFDTDYKALFEADTACELQIVLDGGIIPTKSPYRHTVTIDIPKLKLSAADLSTEGDLVAIQLNFSDQTVLKDTTDPFIQWKVRTNIAGTEILVNG